MIEVFVSEVNSFHSFIQTYSFHSTPCICILKTLDYRHIIIPLTLSNFNGLFHSLIWIKLKWSVGIKGLNNNTDKRMYRDHGGSPVAQLTCLQARPKMLSPGQS